MKLILGFFIFTFMIIFIKSQKIDHIELKCLVCKRLVELMGQEIDQVDPKKRIEVGSYRIDHSGDRKTVEYRRSELYLSELMETICDKMENHVRAWQKSDGRLTIFPLTTENGEMNPIMGEVDIIQDSDINKSLKFYCEGIVEENDSVIIQAFAVANPNLSAEVKVCTVGAQLCKETIQDDNKNESHSEL